MASQWSLQPVVIAAAAVATAWYGWSLVRLHRTKGARPWPRRRTTCFAIGIVLFVWAGCGFAQVYATSLFWDWTCQQLGLLLIVAAIFMAGQPIDLARRTRGEGALVVRMAQSSTGRFFANPLIGPVLIPALSVVLFFGPFAGWAVEVPALGAALPVVLVVMGALIVFPLVSTDDRRGSMAVALALTIGVFELLLDAVPGIALRLHTTIVTSYFDHRSGHVWQPSALHDQQLAGGVLWCVSELIDLPFLLLVYLRWLRADERDAAEIDTVLEAERIARGESEDGLRGATDAPWWLNDPAMQERLRRKG